MNRKSSTHSRTAARQLASSVTLLASAASGAPRSPKNRFATRRYSASFVPKYRFARAAFTPTRAQIPRVEAPSNPFSANSSAAAASSASRVSCPSIRSFLVFIARPY